MRALADSSSLNDAGRLLDPVSSWNAPRMGVWYTVLSIELRGGQLDYVASDGQEGPIGFPAAAFSATQGRIPAIWEFRVLDALRDDPQPWWQWSPPLGAVWGYPEWVRDDGGAFVRAVYEYEGDAAFVAASRQLVSDRVAVASLIDRVEATVSSRRMQSLRLACLSRLLNIDHLVAVADLEELAIECGVAEDMLAGCVCASIVGLVEDGFAEVGGYRHGFVPSTSGYLAEARRVHDSWSIPGDVDWGYETWLRLVEPESPVPAAR